MSKKLSSNLVPLFILILFLGFALNAKATEYCKVCGKPKVETQRKGLQCATRGCPKQVVKHRTAKKSDKQCDEGGARVQVVDSQEHCIEEQGTTGSVTSGGDKVCAGSGVSGAVLQPPSCLSSALGIPVKGASGANSLDDSLVVLPPSIRTEFSSYQRDLLIQTLLRVARMQGYLTLPGALHGMAEVIRSMIGILQSVFQDHQIMQVEGGSGQRHELARIAASIKQFGLDNPDGSMQQCVTQCSVNHQLGECISNQEGDETQMVESIVEAVNSGETVVVLFDIPDINLFLQLTPSASPGQESTQVTVTSQFLNEIIVDGVNLEMMLLEIWVGCAGGDDSKCRLLAIKKRRQT